MLLSVYSESPLHCMFFLISVECIESRKLFLCWTAPCLSFRVCVTPGVTPRCNSISLSLLFGLYLTAGSALVKGETKYHLFLIWAWRISFYVAQMSKLSLSLFNSSRKNTWKRRGIVPLDVFTKDICLFHLIQNIYVFTI